MSVFRDFFTGLWNDYIGTKLDAITDKLKTEIGDRLVSSITIITDLKKAFDTKVLVPINELKTDVVGKLKDIIEVIGDVKDNIELIITELKGVITVLQSIAGFFEKGKGETQGFWDWLKEHWFGTRKWTYTRHIEQTGSVSALETYWLTMPSDITSNPEIIAIYNEHKDNLSAEGYDTPASRILNPFAKGIKSGVKLVTDAALENLMPVFEEFMEEEEMTESQRTQIRAIAGSGEFGLNAIVGFMLGHFLSPVLSTSLAPIWEGMGQEVWKKLPVRNIDPATLIRLKYKGLITDEYFIDVMRQNGYGETAQNNMLNDYLWLPTVGDVISWSVREAFYDDYAATYGLDNEYPSKLNEYGIKIGISDEELKYFWRAHWELPSIMMGYQMLHRDVITSDELDSLFMAADIMPHWRSKLKAISYHPYSRVDVRRLFKTGVIKREDVKRNYLDLGYYEEKAENLTEFTVRDTLTEERDLTRGHVENLYKEGQITSEMAIEDLISLGYDDEESALLIMLIDIKLEDAMDKDLIATWETQFKIHIIDLATLTANIESLNVTLEKKNRIIAKAQRAEIGFVTLPAKADLQKWLELGIITSPIFKTKMQGLGYLPEDITRYEKELESD